MNTRTALIATALLAGLAGGPALLQALAHHPSAAHWSVLMPAFLACAIGLPLGLGLLATRGWYKAMVRVWSSLGLLAIALVAAGASAAALSLAGFGAQPGAMLALALGAGLLAGLGAVKLAIRRGKASTGD